MISVVRRKFITSCSSVFTKAPAVNKERQLREKDKDTVLWKLPSIKK